VRVLIVDDEPLAREGIRARLDRAGSIDVVGECGDGDRAVEMIRSVRPDVVFLDMQMPGRTGLDVVQAVGSGDPPYFVFVTAFDEYAIRAFEVNALDYLVKPIEDERLRSAVARARAALDMRASAERGRRLADWLTDMAGSGAGGGRVPETKLTVRIGNRLVLVAPDEIDWIEASGDYVQLHAGKKIWLMRESLTALEAKLGPLGFTRIHRSCIVNARRVVELKGLDDGEYSVLLRDGTTLKLSRSYRQALDVLLRGSL
jgi:two-component system, LytTR family, response regulator